MLGAEAEHRRDIDGLTTNQTDALIGLPQRISTLIHLTIDEVHRLRLIAHVNTNTNTNNSTKIGANNLLDGGR